MRPATIICVTPNAALDRTLVAPDFAPGHISRIKRGIAVPGGKGLNMMRAVKILGGEPLAMGLLGGHTGKMVRAMVEADGYRANWTWFEGETRTCTIIAVPDGNSTVINESGQIAESDWRALADDIVRAASRESTAAVCFCGSLPDGAPADAPADAIAKLKRQGIPVWVDSSGKWLANAITARPYAVKVNSDELAGVLDIAADDRPALLKAARQLLDDDLRLVVISLGADGAIALTADDGLKATPPSIQPVDPVASGDCLHAGIVVALSQGSDLRAAIRWGVAAGTANALFAGGAQFTYDRFEAILRQTRVQTFPPSKWGDRGG